MNTRFIIAALSLYIGASSCKDAESSNMKYIEQMKDSVFHNYAHVASVTIEVKEGSLLNITLGDAALYKGTDADRQKTANELGMMALRIFPKDNTLDKGRMIVSDDEKNVLTDESKGKTTAINLDSLRKSGK